MYLALILRAVLITKKSSQSSQSSQKQARRHQEFPKICEGYVYKTVHS
jgi:hypothetical protein